LSQETIVTTNLFVVQLRWVNFLLEIGDAGTTRTCDLLLRRQLTYQLKIKNSSSCKYLSCFIFAEYFLNSINLFEIVSAFSPSKLVIKSGLPLVSKQCLRFFSDRATKELRQIRNLNFRCA